MLILGIDPGMQITGYSCIKTSTPPNEPTLVEAGVLRFNSKQPMAMRLKQMHDEIVDLIDQLKPDQLAVEKLYAHYKHPSTAIIMGHARGVILLAGAQAGLTITDLPATEVKKSITGNGHATKSQVQLAVQALYNLPALPTPPDLADAIAIATCCARRISYETM